MKIKSNLPQEIEVTAVTEVSFADLAIITPRMEIAGVVEYNNAGALLARIKSSIKAIEDAWKPLKAAASDTHKKIVAAEKSHVEPYKTAEDTIKTAMTDYVRREKARQEAEEAARRAAQAAEAQRLLEDAIAAEGRGEAADAAMSMAMAEMVEDLRPTAPAPSSAATAFTSVRTTWKARVTDPAAVPVFAQGVEIRPIDESVLNAIARQTKGTASIPGVTFYEDIGIAAKAR